MVEFFKENVKKLKLERKSFHWFFWKLKNVDSFKSYKSLKLSVEKALNNLKVETDEFCILCIIIFAGINIF